MHKRLAAIRGIVDAIALSDLAKGQKDGSTLAVLEDPEVLPQWQPFLARIRTAAAELSKAKDIASAATSAAHLSALCGNCHETASDHANLDADEQPPTAHTLASEMAQHQWAAGRMRDGLVGPSEERWMQGARALSSIRIAVAESKDNLEIWTSRVRTLATNALKKPPGDGPTILFGDLLVACAGCHAAIRDR
jgi:hypothetical protein